MDGACSTHGSEKYRFFTGKYVRKRSLERPGLR
jgi:hypothetical protein